MDLKIPLLDDELLHVLEKIKTKGELHCLVKKETLLHATDSSKNTILHWAARWQNTVMAKYLIELGITINLKNDLGQTALMLAIENNCEDIVEILMNTGADINVQDNHCKNALRMIGDCDRANTKILQLFLRKLQVDCSSNKEEIAKKLFDADWPLYYIIHLNDVEFTKYLLQHGYGTKIDAGDHLGQSALHASVKSVDVENVKVLLEFNADVNMEDNENRTPIRYLYNKSEEHLSERLQILKMLLDRDANVSKRDYDIFNYATREAINLLLDAKIDIFADAMDKINLVHTLALNKYSDTVEELSGREFFADVNDEEYKMMFLMAAANAKNSRSMEFVIEELLAVPGEYGWEILLIFFIRNVITINFEVIYMHSVYMFLEHVNVQLNLGVESTILDVILEKQFFMLAELVISHLVLQEMQGKSIDEFTRNLINSNDRLEIYYESMKQRLVINFTGSITLLDILIGSEKKLELYVFRKNFFSKVQEIFSASTSPSKYYYFFEIMKKRLSKAARMFRLKRDAIPIMCHFTKIEYRRFPFIVGEIVDYLKEQDLKNLIEAHDII